MPQVRAYQPATVIAEKFQAMVALGVLNGRMKDYYDLWAIPRAIALSDDELDAAKDAHLAREYLDALKAAGMDEGTVIDGKDGVDWLAWAEASIERRLIAESDPTVVFQSVAEVTSYSYRDR